MGASRASGAVSVVVPTRDRPELLTATLDAVVPQLREGDELVVADSASRTAGTAEAASKAGVELVRCDLPGAARARNAGVRRSHADVIAFTDDDCRPCPGWVDSIRDSFADPRLGVLVGRVLPDRTSAVSVSVNTDEEPRHFDGPVEPMGIGQSANMAVRREAFEAVGGFDELMGPGSVLPNGEDYDLLWRILAAGWHGAYEPSAAVVHVQWRTRGEGFRAYYAYGIGDGAFAAKVARTDGRVGWRMLRRRVWDRGVAMAARNLLRGYESGAVADALKAAGAVVGAARSARLTIEDGHFGRRR